MTGRRSRVEMYLEVLDKIDLGINKPTNIMYKCNLSWIPMQEILTSLTEKNLIVEIANGNKRTYEITEKGRNLLRYLKSVLDVLGSGKPEVDFEVEGSPKSSVSTQQS